MARPRLPQTSGRLGESPSLPVEMPWPRVEGMTRPARYSTGVLALLLVAGIDLDGFLVRLCDRLLHFPVLYQHPVHHAG